MNMNTIYARDFHGLPLVINNTRYSPQGESAVIVIVHNGHLLVSGSIFVKSSCLEDRTWNSGSQVNRVQRTPYDDGLMKAASKMNVRRNDRA